MNQVIYLDHNATTPVMPAVSEIITKTLALGGNASSVHAAGRLARQKIEVAREMVAKLVGVSSLEVVFTSGGTEANNLVINGIKCERILVSAVEHYSILDARNNVEEVAVDENGLIDLEDLEVRLDRNEGQALVSVMLANNETGVIQPVAKVSEIAKKYGALVHTDAIQACGKIKIDKAMLGADFISLSAHKIGGPQGVGALIIDKEISLEALMRGGGQERGQRAGTENLSGIAGFGVAAEAVEDLSHVDKIRELRDVLEKSIKQITPEIVIYGENVDRLPNTSCIFMPGVSSETQVMSFDLQGILISAGSACSSGKIQASHVLRAMGVEEGIAANVIRVSLGNGNTIQDVNDFVKEWKKIYTKVNTGSLVKVA